MKEVTTNSSMNKAGYFFLGVFIFIEVLAIIGLFTDDEKFTILMLVILLGYLIKLSLPWVLVKRRISVDKANGLIINFIRYKEDSLTKEYAISNIKEYSIKKISQANEIRAKDPTLTIPGDAGTRALHYIGYIEFTDGEILALEYGSKKKVTKKLNEVQRYIEGESNV